MGCRLSMLLAFYGTGVISVKPFVAQQVGDLFICSLNWKLNWDLRTDWEGMTCFQFPGGTWPYASDLTDNWCDPMPSHISLLLKIISLFRSNSFSFSLCLKSNYAQHFFHHDDIGNLVASESLDTHQRLVTTWNVFCQEWWDATDPIEGYSSQIIPVSKVPSFEDKLVACLVS